MSPLVDEIACKLRDSLQASINDFEGLYVFGSQVRGDITSQSDVDIVVLFGHYDMLSPGAFSDIRFQLMYDYEDVIDLDVIPYTRVELENSLSFYDEVVNKGVFYGVG